MASSVVIAHRSPVVSFRALEAFKEPEEDLCLIAFALESGALLLMPLATNLPGLVLCGALWYTGAAIGGARIMALAIAQAPAERRGRAMASYSTALPLSNGIGALISGIVVDWAGYRWMYTIAGILCASGFALIWKQWAKLK